MTDGGIWFIGTIVGLIGWWRFWVERGHRKHVERRHALCLRRHVHDLHDAYTIGRMDGRETAAQRDANLRALFGEP